MFRGVGLDLGVSPGQLERDVDAAAARALAEVDNLAREVETNEQIGAVVTTAVGSWQIGEMIADAMDKVGARGAFAVESGFALGLEVEFVEGMRFEGGYLSSDFVTDTGRGEAVLEDPLILLADTSLSQVAHLIPLAERVLEAGRPLLVVAANVTGEFLATLVLNASRDTLRSVWRSACRGSAWRSCLPRPATSRCSGSRGER